MTRRGLDGPSGPVESPGPSASTRTGGRSRTVPVVLVTAGAVLLAVCLLMLTGQRHLPTAFGGLPAVGAADAGRTTGDSFTAAMRPAGTSSAGPTGTAVPGPVAPPPATTPAEAEAPVMALAPAPVPGAPLTVTLPDRGVSAPVVEILTQDSVLHPPDDPAVVGWWAASALVGATSGSTVLTGHVDSAQAGLGALAGLSDVTAGSRVDVATESGTVGYTVTALLVLDKGAGLPADLFTRTGPPRLVLITCGGPFDQTTLSYRDNVVVLADPA